MQLTHAQKREFYERGFVVLPGVVPPVMTAAAVRAINHSLGEEGMEKAALPTLRAQTYCREVTASPEISGLINGTPAFSLAESLLAPGKLRPPGRGQIALRFPTRADPPPVPAPHVDGVPAPNNGVAAGTLEHFTMLAAVFLSDVAAPDSGNFTVWPGTHRAFEGYFRAHGPQTLLTGLPPMEMPPPHQVLARAGDVVLAHYQLAHSVAANTSPHVRYAVFFRLKHVDHAARGTDVMTDIWSEWDGVRAAVKEAAGV